MTYETTLGVRTSNAYVALPASPDWSQKPPSDANESPALKRYNNVTRVEITTSETSFARDVPFGLTVIVNLLS